MFLIWRGFGILVPLITVVGPITCTVVSGSPYGVGTGLLLSGLSLWFLGQFFEKNDEKNARQLIDPKTNQQVLLKKKHDLFFIPFKWFAIPVMTLGIIALVITNPDKPTDSTPTAKTTRRVR